jgi:hypothetical protein
MAYRRYVGIDDQALQRAAIWYVGAFAALGSVLLAGASIASVDWSRAAHPWLAALLIGMAIAAAFTVVTLAALVINPGCTVAMLRQNEDEVQRRLQQRSGGKAVTWTEVAGSDKRILRALSNYDVSFRRSPNDLWAAARGGDDAAHKELVSMVAVADGWLARRRFRALRRITPMAAVIILVGGVGWKSFTAPSTSDSPTSASPLPVVVTLAPRVSATQLIGPGCTLRVLNGVAVAGNLKSVATIAFAPQGDCPATVINVNPAEAMVQLQ